MSFKFRMEWTVKIVPFTQNYFRHYLHISPIHKRSICLLTASTSCLVIVGARFLKKMDAVLCSGRGLTASSLLPLFFLCCLSVSSTSSASSPLSILLSSATVFSDLSLTSLSDYRKPQDRVWDAKFTVILQKKETRNWYTHHTKLNLPLSFCEYLKHNIIQ